MFFCVLGCNRLHVPSICFSLVLFPFLSLFTVSFSLELYNSAVTWLPWSSSVKAYDREVWSEIAEPRSAPPIFFVRAIFWHIKPCEGGRPSQVYFVVITLESSVIVLLLYYYDLLSLLLCIFLIAFVSFRLFLIFDYPISLISNSFCPGDLRQVYLVSNARGLIPEGSVSQCAKTHQSN